MPPSARHPVAIAGVAATSRSRLLAIVGSLLGWLIGDAWLRARGRHTAQEQARRLRAVLERLGGFWIKVGQLLSLRVDLLPEAVCRELASLQHQAVGFPGRIARGIVVAELGVPIENVFEHFEEVPAAAASVAQIHKARLRGTGIWVAVKVQRPEIEATFALDMALVRRVAWLCGKLSLLPALRWVDFAWELEQTLVEEVDYRFEAENLRRMKKTLRAHRIYVPKVFRQYSTRRVLVMEWIDAVLMSDYIAACQAEPQRLAAWLAENNVDPRRVGRRLYFSSFRQVQEDNLFHSDLHPGNIGLLRDSRIALLDFGSVGSLERENHAKYYLFLESLAAGEYSKAIDFLFLLNHALPDVDLEDLKQDLIRALRVWERRTLTKGLPYAEKSQANLTLAMGKVLYAHRLTPEWFFLKVTRATNTLDAALMYLLPDADFGQLLRRYFASARHRRLRAALRGREAARLADGWVRLAETVPSAGEARVPASSILRREALVFEGRSSAPADLLAYLFGTVAAAILFAGALLLYAFFFARHPPVAQALTGPLASRMGAFLARLKGLEWVALWGALAYLFVTSLRFRRRFARKQHRRPGRFLA